MKPQKMLTVREAATRVGRSERTIRRWIASGQLPIRVAELDVLKLEARTRLAANTRRSAPDVIRSAEGR